MKFGTICLINFNPGIGREYKKIRPAIVVQEADITQKSPYLTVLPITSKVSGLTEPDIFIPKDEKNNLAKNSIIKVRQICGFDKSRLVQVIGSANSPTIRKVRGYLRKHFGL